MRNLFLSVTLAMEASFGEDDFAASSGNEIFLMYVLCGESVFCFRISVVSRTFLMRASWKLWSEFRGNFSDFSGFPTASGNAHLCQCFGFFSKEWVGGGYHNENHIFFLRWRRGWEWSG